MCRNNTKKPEETKGYNIFLGFVYRYILFGYKNRFGESKQLICLDQRKIGNFLNKSRSSVRDYIDKAVNEDGFLTIEGKGIFKKNQAYESNIYSFDLNSMMTYLVSKGINPIANKKEAKAQIDAFTKSLNGRQKKLSPEERNKYKEGVEKRKKYRSDKLKKSFIHDYYNRIIRDYNARLEELGLSKYKDSFLDEYDFRASSDFSYTRNPIKHEDDAERVKDLKKVGIVPADEFYMCEFIKKGRKKRRIKRTSKRYAIKSPLILHTGTYLENVYEKDTNASIYRLTYNLNHEEQLSQDFDVYQLFWEAAGFEQPYNKDVKNKGLKIACMPIYMKEQAIPDCRKTYYREKHIRTRNAKRTLIILDGITKEEKDDERFEAYEFLTSYTGLSLHKVLNSLSKAMHEVLGVEKFYGRDIFLYESELHADIKVQLLNRGIFVLNAFDGFFGKPDELTQELYFEVYYNATETLKAVLRNDAMLKNEFLEDERTA